MFSGPGGGHANANQMYRMSTPTAGRSKGRNSFVDRPGAPVPFTVRSTSLSWPGFCGQCSVPLVASCNYLEAVGEKACWLANRGPVNAGRGSGGGVLRADHRANPSRFAFSYLARPEGSQFAQVGMDQTF